MSRSANAVISVFNESARYHEHLDALNVSASALYEALIADAEVQPPNWDLQGRQVNIWKQIGTPVRDGLSELAYRWAR